MRMRNARQKAGATVAQLELPSEGHANWRPNTSTRVFPSIPARSLILRQLFHAFGERRVGGKDLLRVRLPLL